MTIKFIFTCGCITDQASSRETVGRGARFCPYHPKRSLKQVNTQCEICGEELTFKPGAWKTKSLKLCRKHKLIREAYMNWASRIKSTGSKRIQMSWEDYLATYDERNKNRTKRGPIN